MSQFSKSTIVIDSANSTTEGPGLWIMLKFRESRTGNNISSVMLTDDQKAEE